MQNVKTLFLSLLICPFFVSAQSINWFETIGIKNFSSNSGYPFYAAEVLANDSAIYVAANTPAIQKFHFYRSNDSVSLPIQRCCSPSGFVAKYTTDGRFQWARLLGTFANNQNMVLTERDGFIYAAAIIGEQGYVGSDTLKNRLNNSIVLVKFDKNGHEIWRKFSSSFAFPFDIRLRKLLATADNQVYLAGEKSSSFRALAFENAATEGKAIQFVFRFDTSGRAVRAATLNEDEPSLWHFRLLDFNADDKGNVFALISPSGRNVSSSCGYRTWRTLLYKLDKNGMWTKISDFQCSDLIVPNSLGVAQNGDLLVTGSYRGVIQIGAWQSPNVLCDSRNLFVLRLTAEGRFVWFHGHSRPDDFSEGYKLLREKDDTWLVAGYESRDWDKPISHRYPNVGDKYPNGKSRIFIKRLSPLGIPLDSVFFHNRGFDEKFNNLSLAQNSQKTYLMGQYECFFDSLSASTCYYEGFREAYGSKIFLAELNENILQKRQNPPKNDPSVFRLFPNPATTILQINFQETLTNEASVEIVDMSGRIVYRANILRGAFYHLVDCQNWAKSVYLVRVKTENGVSNQKIVKS
jgi:hypothetical protein